MKVLNLEVGNIYRRMCGHSTNDCFKVDPRMSKNSIHLKEWIKEQFEFKRDFGALNTCLVQ